MESSDIILLKRGNLVSRLNEEMAQKEIYFTDTQVNQIYDMLKKYTQVSEEVKLKHIENIKSKKAH